VINSILCREVWCVFFAKSGQKRSQNGKKRQYFVHHWKAQGFDNNPYGNHYKLWLSRQYTNPVFIRKRDSRYNLNYYYRGEGGKKTFFNPPITGMRICDKSWEIFLPKIAKKVAKMAKKWQKLRKKKWRWDKNYFFFIVETENICKYIVINQ